MDKLLTIVKSRNQLFQQLVVNDLDPSASRNMRLLMVCYYFLFKIQVLNAKLGIDRPGALGHVHL